MQANVSGIFPLFEGRHIESTTSNGRRIRHILYETLMFTEEQKRIPGTIQLYCPPCMKILPSETLVLVTHGRILFVSNESGVSFQVETEEDLAPFSGDVANEDYDDFLPDRPFLVPSIYLLGQVCSKITELPDGGRSVDLKCSSYFQNKRQDFRVRCRVPSGPRWVNVSLPSPGSALHVIGKPCTVLKDGIDLPVITIKQLVYNPDLRNSVTSNHSNPEQEKPSSQRSPENPRRVYQRLSRESTLVDGSSVASNSSQISENALVPYVNKNNTEEYIVVENPVKEENGVQNASFAQQAILSLFSLTLFVRSLF